MSDDMTIDDVVDFIAAQFSVEDHQRQGFAMGTRWGVTSEQRREKFRERARAAVRRWIADERRAEAARQMARTGREG